jgi:DNA-binding MurR/RpiR family transcriptional regulator
MRDNMSKNDVLQDLKDNYNQLTGSQKIIGKYVLDHYREIAFLSAIELGEKVGVSDATIIRFARSIGFSGFAELRNHIRAGIKNFDSPYKRLSKSFDIFEDKNNLTMQVGKIDLKNLEDFLLNIEIEKIEKATDAISEAHNIYLIGMRSSGILIDFLALHLRRMGFKVIAISEGGIVNAEKIISITKNDLLITCSFPRYSKPTYNAIILAKTKGAKVLTITDSDFSTISINSDIVFSLRIDNSTFFNSYIVPMELCNILIMSLLEKDKEKIYMNLKENIQSMEVFDTRL